MARISIDDELHADHRFKRLVKKLGDEDKAIGMLYRFWRLAQDYWADDQLLPVEQFEAEEIAVLEEFRFAERKETGYYACGAEERFAWLNKQKKAAVAGGVARAKSAERDEKGHFIKPDAQPVSSRCPAGVQPAPSQQPALPSVSHLSSSHLSSISTDMKREPPPAGDEKGPVPELESLVGADVLLKEIPHNAQRAWIGVFGIEIVSGQIPLAYVGWLAKPHRAAQGNPALFLRHWFENAKEKQADKQEAKEKPGVIIEPGTARVTDWEAERTRRTLKENDEIKPAPPPKNWRKELGME